MHRVKPFVLLLTLSLAPGCNVVERWFGKDPIEDPIENPTPDPCIEDDCCQTDKDCFRIKAAAHDPDPSNWTCDEAKQLCAPIVRPCIGDDDSACCPGQKCSMVTEADGFCADLVTACNPDEPVGCTVKGQYCEPNLGTRGQTSAGCTFRACMADADCSGGLRCFNGSCVGEAPCGGGCKAGEVCTPVTNRCFRLGELDNGSCRQTCSKGTILVFSDPTNVFGACDIRERDCTCLQLSDFTTMP